MTERVTRRLPEAMAARARAFLNGAQAPVTPRAASTVVLLRDRPGGGTEVYLLRRQATMAFAGGMYAFPGGALDPRDGDDEVSLSGPDLAWWAGRMGCDAALARAFLCAAVRETFEEAGVLLAGPSEDTVARGDAYEPERRALVGRSLSFAEFLRDNHLVVRADLLAPWGHWITPEFEERRYDAWFFVAALPADQRARDLSSEADQVRWLAPSEAVARCRSGELAMLPPTLATLSELAAHWSVAEVLAAAPGRDIAPITPAVVTDDDGCWLVLPGEGGYPG